jgi:hypothetical protein
MAASICIELSLGALIAKNRYKTTVGVIWLMAEYLLEKSTAACRACKSA